MKKIFNLLAALLISFSVTYAQTTPAQTQHLKKDGTADKRFKDNKTPKSTGPLKKDGTPDMRYKKNNPNAGKKKTS